MAALIPSLCLSVCFFVSLSLASKGKRKFLHVMTFADEVWEDPNDPHTRIGLALKVNHMLGKIQVGPCTWTVGNPLSSCTHAPLASLCIHFLFFVTSSLFRFCFVLFIIFFSSFFLLSLSLSFSLSPISFSFSVSVSVCFFLSFFLSISFSLMRITQTAIPRRGCFNHGAWVQPAQLDGRARHCHHSRGHACRVSCSLCLYGPARPLHAFNRHLFGHDHVLLLPPGHVAATPLSLPHCACHYEPQVRLSARSARPDPLTQVSVFPLWFFFFDAFC